MLLFVVGRMSIAISKNVNIGCPIKRNLATNACSTSYFYEAYEGHPEMLASHKIGYQFLLPCNPSAYCEYVCTWLKKKNIFILCAVKRIIENSR
jgi:hypothetical protein